MLTLFSYQNSYSMTAQVALEEIGLEYELRWTKIHIPNADKSVDLMDANPNGRVPTLLTPEGPIYETAAILVHMAEQNPQCGLIPDISAPERRLFWQWHFYLVSTFMPEELIQDDPSVYLPDNEPGQRELALVSMDRLLNIWTVLDRGIAGPYILGDQYTTCDISFAMQALWPSCQPPEGLKSYPNAHACLKRILDRPAVREVLRQHDREYLADV
jgi:glutathione S-transferase